MVQIDNPYWNEVKDLVGDKPDPTWGSYQIGDEYGEYRQPISELVAQVWRLRAHCTRMYAWTVTSPQTLDFVVEHARGKIIDPMAGTGYWSYLLQQSGVDCVSTDLVPPAPYASANRYHKNAETYVPVLQADAVEAVTMMHPDRTLLLSWPPMDSSGFKALAAYPGNRLIYIGEGWGGCTADDDFFKTLESEWDEVAFHFPVQFSGIHDHITVYDRIQPLPES
jgi:hypothetical protein